MNRTWQELISAYLDGELSPAQRAEVEQLLVESAEYRRLWSDFRDMQRRLQSLPRLELDDDFAQRVLQRAEFAWLSQRDAANAARAASEPAPTPDSPLPSEAPTGYDSDAAACMPAGRGAWREHGWIAAAMVLAAGLLLMVAGPWQWPEAPRPQGHRPLAHRPSSAPPADVPTRSWHAHVLDELAEATAAAPQGEIPGQRSNSAGDAPHPPDALGGLVAGAAAAPGGRGATLQAEGSGADNATDAALAGPLAERRRGNVELELQRRSDAQRAKSLEPPAQHAASDEGGLLVVHVEITEDAWRRGDFRQLLQEYDIDWSGTPDVDQYAEPQTGAPTAAATASGGSSAPSGRGGTASWGKADFKQSLVAADYAAGAAAALGGNRSEAPRRAPASAMPLQVVHVQAAAAQLHGVLAELRRRGETAGTYTQVALVPVPDDPLQREWTGRFSFALPWGADQPATEPPGAVAADEQSTRETPPLAQQGSAADRAATPPPDAHPDRRKSALAQRIDYLTHLRAMQLLRQQPAVPAEPLSRNAQSAAPGDSGIAAAKVLPSGRSADGGQPQSVRTPTDAGPSDRAPSSGAESEVADTGAGSAPRAPVVRALFVFHVVSPDTMSRSPAPAVAP